ncbi:hypothetical protein BH11ARM2_BH11ARM2_04940 [soil metagenome]
MRASSAVTLTLLTLGTCLVGAYQKATRGQGPVVSQTRNASAVKRIVVAGGIELKVTPGSPSLRLSAQRNILSLIETKFDHGTLTIGPKGSFSTSEPIQATLQMPSLQALNATGGSRATVGSFGRADIDLNAMGGAEIVWKGDVNTLNASATGGSTIRLLGKARSASIEGTGAGAVDVDGLEGGKLSLTLTGASHSSIQGRASDLTIEATGASEANLGTLASNRAKVTASGASTVKIGRTGGGSATASGASNIEYRGRLDHVEGTGSSNVTSR